MVPLDGVDAKLNIASKAPTEQRMKARKARGLNIPDSDEDFFCMGMVLRFDNVELQMSRI